MRTMRMIGLVVLAYTGIACSIDDSGVDVIEESVTFRADYR